MKQKPFYLYGAFIIIFISACLLWIIRTDTFAEKATSIDYLPKDFYKNYPGPTLEEYIKTKTIISLKLNGNQKYNDSILNLFQLEIQKIMRTQDAHKGIHIQFSKQTTYENVIRAFQICKIENCSTYIPDGYDFWVFPYYKKKAHSKPTMPK